MPTRYVNNFYNNQYYYHIFNRGDRKLVIFEDNVDKAFFINLLQRYLSQDIIRNKSRHNYPNYANTIKLCAFAIMGNHFHLLLKQNTDDKFIIPKFMQSVIVSYSYYYRKKYGIEGTVFKGTYMAKTIEAISKNPTKNCKDSTTYLKQVIHYIHNNKQSFDHDMYSSLYYFKNEYVDWLSSDVINMFGGINEYLQDYREYKSNLNKLTD